MKKKKAIVSKVIVLFLIVVMMMSVSSTVFAVESTDKGAFTVAGLDASSEKKVTVSAYPIITVNIDNDAGQPKYPMYQWNEAVVLWMEEYYADYIGEDDEVEDVFKNLAADKMNLFLQQLTAAIKAGTKIDLRSTDKEATSGSVQFTGMNMGVYLLTASGGVTLYKPTTVKLLPVEENGAWKVDEDASAEMKSNDPEIIKTVTDPDKRVAIGDTVNYQLTVDVPDYPAGATAVKLRVRDTLGTGLTLDADSITVYTGPTVAGGDKVTEGSNTFSMEIDSNKNEFSIEFKEPFITANVKEKLTVVYSATVNADAFTIDSLGNEAFIGYNNDPYDDTSYREKSDPENVYTYGIGLIKKNADESETLSGAQFEIRKESEVLNFKETDDGVYTYDSTGGTSVVEVDANGNLLVKGLDAGTYILEETKAPSGYVLPSGEITVVIKDEEPDGEIDEVNVTTSGNVQTTDAAVNNADKNVMEFNVLNNDTNFTLPSTGGMGTMIFTILGIVLMAGAVAIMIVISRKKRL